MQDRLRYRWYVIPKNECELPHVYSYDCLPETLKVQIGHIWLEAVETGKLAKYDSIKVVVKGLRSEYGFFICQINTSANSPTFLKKLMLKSLIDAVELTFQYIEGGFLNGSGYHGNFNNYAEQAVADLNTGLREHGIGYEFNSGSILPANSQFIHSKIANPALQLLNKENYLGPQKEFPKAYKHYREGDFKEAHSFCLNTLESVMNTICEKMIWRCDKNAAAKSLIETCFCYGLIPIFC